MAAQLFTHTIHHAHIEVHTRIRITEPTVIIASNSYMLQGGDNYSAFRAGSNYGELEMSYTQPLHEYLAAHPKLSAAVPETGTRA